MSPPKPAAPFGSMLRRLGLALAVGATGGALFYWAHLPLPWMLGAMFGCVLGAFFGLPIGVPNGLRSAMSVIIGVLLGSSFSPELLAGALNWLPSLAGAAGFVVVSGTLSVLYFRFVAGYDARTAYYCGMPGGVVEMVLQADAAGADARRVALVHAARVLLVVFSVPFLVQFLTGMSFSRPAAGATRLTDLTLLPVLWFAGTAGLGWLAARVVPLPAPYLFAPMILSLFVHAMGWTSFKPPIEIVVLAQVALGASIGCRFAGIGAAEFLRAILVSIGATALLIGLTLVFAFAVSNLAGIDMAQVLLAYSPGGLMEMGLVALSIDMEIAFVMVHHLFRILFVTAGAALLAGPLGFSRPPKAPDSGAPGD